MSEWDKPADRPQVPAVSALAIAFYGEPGHAVGGCLHIALDDGNLDDGHLDTCIEGARERCHCGRVPCPSGLELATALRAMTRTQRKNVHRRLRLSLAVFVAPDGAGA